MSLSGKTAHHGALTGIGRATALAFVRKVRASWSRSTRRCRAGMVTEPRSRREAEFVRADVRHEDDVRNLVDKRSRALAA